MACQAGSAGVAGAALQLLQAHGDWQAEGSCPGARVLQGALQCIPDGLNVWANKDTACPISSVTEIGSAIFTGPITIRSRPAAAPTWLPCGAQSQQLVRATSQAAAGQRGRPPTPSYQQHGCSLPNVHMTSMVLPAGTAKGLLGNPPLLCRHSVAMLPAGGVLV